jgi:cobalt-zinc-cadmium efflux system outer membrane protein
MTIAYFEELALRNNPTLAQASADINKAVALRDQVGRYPNPVVGYSGSQIADDGTDQHGVFVEQEIVRGNKLPLNQQVMRHAIEAQAADADAQTLRVLTDVRTQFLIALAAQEQMRLTGEFKAVAAEGVEIARQRLLAQEGSQPELLQAEIQLSEIDLAYEQAAVAFGAAFRNLAAVAGAANLQPGLLEGELSQPQRSFDWDAVYMDMLAASPELQAAQARLEQACAQLQRERVQAIPNPTLQLGAGVDNGTGSGFLNVEVSTPISIHNSNRGNICAAQADYDRASQELSRIELSIKSRLADVGREYDSALAAVRKYETEILPKSTQSRELLEALYRAGETDFLQAFLVRKNWFESNLRYVQSLSELAQARAKIDGLLLEGGLDPAEPFDGDDSNRERVFAQQ